MGRSLIVKELFDKFVKLGWSTDSQSISIFTLLMKARQKTLPNTILLDMGAGKSRYNFFFEHCHYISVDFAQGDSNWDYSKLDFFGNICDLNFIKDGSVDNCLNTTTLEHLNEPSNFFSEVYRIHKPNGKLFLYVPFIYSEHQIPHDYFRYTSYGLKYLCKKAGLRVISIKPSNSPVHTASRWANIVVDGTRGKGFLSNIMLKIIKFLFKSGLIPLFNFLERYSTEEGFPICWLLVAEKTSSLRNLPTTYEKKIDAKNSMIYCPECKNSIKQTENSCICVKCKKKFPSKDGQINFIQ